MLPCHDSRSPGSRSYACVPLIHGDGNVNSYIIRRRWDYFIRGLLGATPPEGFEIKSQSVPTNQ